MKDSLIYYCAFILIVFSVYSGIIHVHFSQPDDKWMLLDNTLVRNASLSFEYLYQVFTQKNNIQYSPINTLYYALIYQIDGYNPFYYHLGSLLLHILNIFLVMRLYQTVSKKQGILTEYLFIAAILWGLHPLNVESVVWISASKILLSTLFMLIAINIVFKYKERKTLTYTLLFFLYLLACFSKEQSIVLVFIFILIDTAFHKKNLKSFLKLEYLLYTLVLLGFAYVTLSFNLNSMEMVRYSFLERFLLMFYSLFWYCINTFLPYDLHYHYPFPINPGDPIPVYYYVYIVLIVYGLYFLITKIRLHPHILKNAYLLIIAIIFLALCLHIIPMYRQAMYADRYMYQPLIYLLVYFSIYFHDFKYFKWFLFFYLIYFSIYSYKLVYNWSFLNMMN